MGFQPKLDKDKIRALYDEGYGDARIAEECKCSRRAIYSWRKQNGNKPPNRGVEARKRISRKPKKKEEGTAAGEYTHNPERCAGCYYWRVLGGGNTREEKGCHHMLETGKRRKIGSDGDCLSRDTKRVFHQKKPLVFF